MREGCAIWMSNRRTYSSPSITTARGGGLVAASVGEFHQRLQRQQHLHRRLYKLGDLDDVTNRTQQFQVDDGDDRYLSLFHERIAKAQPRIYLLGVSAYHLLLKLSELPSGLMEGHSSTGSPSLSARVLPEGIASRASSCYGSPRPDDGPSAQDVADRARAYVEIAHKS